MANTSNRTQSDCRARLEQLINEFDSSIPEALHQALRSLLTAMDYNDNALMKSHLTTVLDHIAEVITQATEEWLRKSQSAMEFLESIMSQIEADPIDLGETLDELGRSLNELADRVMSELTEIQSGPVAALLKCGIDVPNAAQLENEIKKWRGLKEGFLGTWPWSNQELPPVDRGMVAASKAAFGQEEGIPIEDLIRQLGGDPTRK